MVLDKKGRKYLLEGHGDVRVLQVATEDFKVWLKLFRERDIRLEFPVKKWTGIPQKQNNSSDQYYFIIDNI